MEIGPLLSQRWKWIANYLMDRMFVLFVSIVVMELQFFRGDMDPFIFRDGNERSIMSDMEMKLCLF